MIQDNAQARCKAVKNTGSRITISIKGTHQNITSRKSSGLVEHYYSCQPLPHRRSSSCKEESHSQQTVLYVINFASLSLSVPRGHATLPICRAIEIRCFKKLPVTDLTAPDHACFIFFCFFSFYFFSLSDIMDLRHQSSAMCIIMLGGEDTHPWSALNMENPILATIPVTKIPINKLLIPANIPGYGTICRTTICRKLTQGQFAE